MIVLDTSVVYALLDMADRRHIQALAWYQALDDELVTTPLVLAETNHLAATRLGALATRAFHRDVRNGAYQIDWWSSAAGDSADLADRYEDLGIGLTDASLVVLAARIGTATIATFDERHFRAVIPLNGEAAFRLVPVDA